MALDLTFTVEERNDNLVITLTDTSGSYVAVDNVGGWDATGINNPDPSDIGASGTAHTLELSLKITTSDGTVTTYDDVDLFTEFGALAIASDFVFGLDCSMFSYLGTALGTDEDEFPDGIYEFTYMYNQIGVGAATEVVTQVIDGRVRNDVYHLLRIMGTTYECNGSLTDGIMLAVFTKAYLDSMSLIDVDARPTSILDILYTLERQLINIPTYDF